MLVLFLGTALTERNSCPSAVIGNPNASYNAILSTKTTTTAAMRNLSV
jgi:hypothetical protein